MNYIRISAIAVFILLFSQFFHSLFTLHNDINEDLRVELEHYNNLFADAANSTFNEAELLLDMLGTHLLKDDMFKNKAESQKIMQEMMRRYPFVLGFGLTDKEGLSTVASANVDPSKLQKLSETEDSRESFLQTLNSDKMVVGHVYYHKSIGSWIIPLRKALRNDKGEVVAVMTTGLAISGANHFLHTESLYPDQYSVMFTGNTLHRVYMSSLEEERYATVYKKTFPLDTFESAITQGESSLGLSRKEIKDREQTFFCEIGSDLVDSKVLSVVRYNNKFELWVATVLPKSAIVDLHLTPQLFTRITVFLVVMVLLVCFFIFLYRKDKERSDSLIYQVTHDSLTGLRNRSSLLEMSSSWTRNVKHPFLLLFIDLDHFKKLNDSFGHLCGDEVLKKVATRIKKSVPDSSKIFRLGGDEFAIFLKDYDTASQTNVFKDIINTIAEPYSVNDMRLRIGSSIGISEFPKDATSIDQLMMFADLAMYNAKEERNRYSLYNDVLHVRMKRKTSIEAHLRDALETLDPAELYMVFQPQVDNEGKVLGVETLVRWENKSLGFVSPDEFIGVAEDAGLMPRLGALILERSCSDFSEILKQSKGVAKNMSLSINVSVKQLLEETFQDRFVSVIDQYGLKRKNISIEVTESIFIDQMDFILPLLADIKAKGIKISLDDFGTGYSSLNILRVLPIDELKIDKSFVDDIASNKQDSEMVKSIINMGHLLDMKVLAEGVEEVVQLDLLRSHGCDMYQGYCFSKPLKANDFIKYLEANIG